MRTVTARPLAGARVLLLVLTGVLLLAHAGPAAAATVTVPIGGDGPAPSVTVAPGDVVVWRNATENSLTLTATTPNWSYTRAVPAGGSTEGRPFPDSGNYGYRVDYPALVGSGRPSRDATITVQGPGTGGPGLPAPPAPSASTPPDPTAPSSPAPSDPPADPGGSGVPSASAGPAPSGEPAPAEPAPGDPGAAGPPGADPSPSPAGTPDPGPLGRGTTSLTGGFGSFGGFSVGADALAGPVPPPQVAGAPGSLDGPVLALPALRPQTEEVALRPGTLPGAPSSRGRGLATAIGVVLLVGVATAVGRAVVALHGPRRPATGSTPLTP